MLFNYSLINKDSLGKCHKTSTGPEGIVLKSSADVNENLILKRKAISNYLFYLAFENTIEPGLVVLSFVYILII